MTNYEKIIDMNIRQMANEINNGHLGNPCDYCFLAKVHAQCHVLRAL